MVSGFHTGFPEASNLLKPFSGFQVTPHKSSPPHRLAQGASVLGFGAIKPLQGGNPICHVVQKL